VAAIRRFRLPTEIPLEEYPSPEEFIREAMECVEEAEKRGLILRVMGGMAIYMHSRQYEELWRKLGRLGKRVFTDIDFASYGKFRNKVMKFLKERGYMVHQRAMFGMARERLIFFGERIPMVEVFFDRLRMNHVIEFKNRLEVDRPTIPLAELLLQKIQIVHMNEKDIKDTIVLIRAHEIGESDEETINAKHIAKIMANDWGFYYTSTTNLKKISESLDKYEVLSDEDKEIVRQRINKLLTYIENEPKTFRWKMRARVGTKKKWYEDVEEWITS